MNTLEEAQKVVDDARAELRKKVSDGELTEHEAQWRIRQMEMRLNLWESLYGGIDE